MPKTIIEETNLEYIKNKLIENNIGPAHFTNGIYDLSAKIIHPTLYASFAYVLKEYGNYPIIVAINSDISVANLITENKLGREVKEDQTTRAHKVADILTDEFPDSQIVILFYDQETPEELYRSLSSNKHTFTLFKWGYGTEEKEPTIIGYQFFEHVLASPLPNNGKAICHDSTPETTTEELKKINVIDLREEARAKGELIKPYYAGNSPQTLFRQQPSTETKATLPLSSTPPNSPR